MLFAVLVLPRHRTQKSYVTSTQFPRFSTQPTASSAVHCSEGKILA